MILGLVIAVAFGLVIAAASINSIGYRLRMRKYRNAEVIESVFNQHYNETRFREIQAWVMTCDTLRQAGEMRLYRQAKKRLREAQERHQKGIVYVQDSGREIKAIEMKDLKG